MPRVALFADSFFEVNGAAQACRQLESFASRHEYPFLSVHCGEAEEMEESEPLWTLQLRRRRLAVQIDRDLHFDVSLWKRRLEICDVARRFRPDLIHITSPGDLGILGAWVAHMLRVPLVASWHTNLHEFAGRRLMKMLAWVPRARVLQAFTEHWILQRVLWFFSRAAVTFAPNQELVTMIAAHSGKPCFLMTRGIDMARFAPSQRSREEGPFTLGFVGRLMPEKNVRLLAKLERELTAAGAPAFRFLVVGDGSEAGWLRSNLRQATFTGILTGDALAKAYADMDQTDTFGNVILEALASGVPAIVSACGGPKHLVRAGVTGFVAESDGQFVTSILGLMNAPGMLSQMRVAARESARAYSWDRVFEEVYAGYWLGLRPEHAQPLEAVPSA